MPVVGHGCQAENFAQLLSHVHRAFRETSGCQLFNQVGKDLSHDLRPPHTFSIGAALAFEYSLHGFGPVVYRQVRPVLAYRATFGTTYHYSKHVALAYSRQQSPCCMDYYCQSVRRLRASTSRMQTLLPYQRGTETTDDYAALFTEAIILTATCFYSYYTGISYGDMCRLTTANLETTEDGTAWIKAAREKTKAIIYQFTPTVIQNRTALRIPTEAPAKADLRNRFRFCCGGSAIRASSIALTLPRVARPTAMQIHSLT